MQGSDRGKVVSAGYADKLAWGSQVRRSPDIATRAGLVALRMRVRQENDE